MDMHKNMVEKKMVQCLRDIMSASDEDYILQMYERFIRGSQKSN